MEQFYATFGTSHIFGGFYISIKAESYDHAAKAMFEQFGKTWAFVYHEDTLDLPVDEWADKWEYQRLCTITVQDVGTPGYENLKFDSSIESRTEVQQHDQPG